MQISFEGGTLHSPPLVESCFYSWSFLIPFRSALIFAFFTGINLELGLLYQLNSFPRVHFQHRYSQPKKPNVTPEFGVKPSLSTTRHFAVSFCRYMLLWRNEMTVPNCTGIASSYFSCNELLQGP